MRAGVEVALELGECARTGIEQDRRPAGCNEVPASGTARAGPAPVASEHREQARGRSARSRRGPRAQGLTRTPAGAVSRADRHIRVRLQLNHVPARISDLRLGLLGRLPLVVGRDRHDPLHPAFLQMRGHRVEITPFERHPEVTDRARRQVRGLVGPVVQRDLHAVEPDVLVTLARPGGCAAEDVHIEPPGFVQIPHREGQVEDRLHGSTIVISLRHGALHRAPPKRQRGRAWAPRHGRPAAELSLPRVFRCLDLHTDGQRLLRLAQQEHIRTRRRIEGQLEQDFGSSPAVILRTTAELRRVLATSPYPAQGADPARHHVTFLATKPGRDKLSAFSPPQSGRDELVVIGKEVYVHTPDGYGNSKLNGAMLERRLGVVSTTRNWNTVTKLCALAAS